MAAQQPITKQLADLINNNGWEGDFEKAIAAAQSVGIPRLRPINSLPKFLGYVNDLVTWAPREHGDSRTGYNKFVEFYFFLDQEPLAKLQNQIEPGAPEKLTPLSQWIVDFAKDWGSYLDTPESAAEIETFKTDPAFDWEAYMPPPSGYRTFNQFFARHVKPGVRPIAGMRDDTIIVAPADSRFMGWWSINETSEIFASQPPLNIKGLRWSIEELLQGSQYADRFRGGIFTHSFLDAQDYHRLHTPVQGKVLESRVIQGAAYLYVQPVPAQVAGGDEPVLTAMDQTGYQFQQTRGLMVIESPIGLVACLPVGMAQVSSVVLTAETGKTLYKGEELGYFQFGGSDFVMVFERASNVQLNCTANQHYNQGMAVGTAYPYSAH